MSNRVWFLGGDQGLDNSNFTKPFFLHACASCWMGEEAGLQVIVRNKLAMAARTFENGYRAPSHPSLLAPQAPPIRMQNAKKLVFELF